jgi:hypothetical protein
MDGALMAVEDDCEEVLLMRHEHPTAGAAALVTIGT